MSPRHWQLAALAGSAALVAALAGCSTWTHGMGGGEIESRNGAMQPVLFSWRSNDGGISGSMAAATPTATYTGQFVQITSETRETELAPLWTGWRGGWGDWPYWGAGFAQRDDLVRFTRDYSGKVVANLADAGGQHMRCRFVLDDPAAGMAGGGAGECQMPGGKVIAAVIARQ